LASDWSIPILRLSLPSVPAAVHEVKSSQRDLDDDEADGLITDKKQDSAFQFIVEIQVEVGYEQVEYEMKENSGNDYKHRPIGKGVRMPHF
jgi:hypothetical protein